MNLYFDLDAGYFVTSPGSRERLATMELKRGDTCSLAVRFLTGGTVTGLATGATGKFGMKEQGDFDGDFVASAGTWTKTGTGSSTVYTFEVNLATTELNTLLGVGVAADVASVLLNAEMEFIADGVRTSSNTIACTVYNDVIRGTESGPAEIADGTPINPTATVTGTLTSDGSTPVEFVDMIYVGEESGKMAFTDTGDLPGIGGNYKVYNDSTQWSLEAVSEAAYWNSSATVERPDEIPTGAWHATNNPDAWKPQGTATGTPVVTIAQTAGVVGSMKTDGDFLYVAHAVVDAGTLWKKTALSAL